MKKFKRKAVALFATLAMAATSAFGLLSLAACTDSNETFGSDTGSTQIDGNKTYSVSSVFGTRTVTASENTYYVSPDGTGDGSAESPADLMTLVSGDASTLQPGDTVILKDGVYSLTSTLAINVSGTYDMPITIKAENNGAAILDCYSQGWGTRGVNLGGNYINFIGITVRGAGDNGMYLAGSYNLVEDCEFYDNRDSGLQIGRNTGNTVDLWPSYNLVKNCTSHNNYDNQTLGENADGFAAKLTLGYGNVFDGRIAYRNSDDGWDLYARLSQGNIGAVYIYNCVAFENGYLEYTQEVSNARYGDSYDHSYDEVNTNSYTTANGDGNGFKLGGESMEGDVFVYNSLSFGNRMHGFTDNSNPGYISIKYSTAVDNGAGIDNDPTSETFGQINDTSSGGHSNYDVSRQTYSYNHLDHVLSVATAMGTAGLEVDNYRGSVQDSYFYQPEGSGAWVVEGTLDADSKNDIGGEDAAQVTADVFTQVNATVTMAADGTKSYTYNISGLESRDAASTIHNTYRNEDGSVNMGDLFAIDQTKLFGADNAIGATLNLGSYEEYTHYQMSDLSTASDAVEARLMAARDMLYIQTDENAVYQDFEAVSKIYGCEVSWSSGNSDVLEVGKSYTGSDISEAEYVPIIVHRPEEDTEVTLTATIYYFGQSITKEFTLNVVADNPSIGEITVIGPDGSELTDGDSIIVDKYTVLADPQITVLNGADYSGKVITEEQATFETTYEYGEDIAALNSGDSQVVAGFTTAQDGAFKITMTVTLTRGDNAGESAEFSYYVLVASNTADIEFLNDEYAVTVNAGGYNVTGDLTSAIGTLYAYSSATELSDENKTAEYIMEHGDSEEFRATRISFDFPNANTGAYHIYMVFTNGNGEVTSEIYETSIGVVEISTEQQFYELAQHITTTTSTVVYALTEDLDFTGFDYAIASGSFSSETVGFMGLFNGNGHTISNITINNTDATSEYTGVFRSLLGGTVTNVNFENISVSGSDDKIGGIFGTILYGTVSDINITNVTVTALGSNQRIGGLAGQINSNDNPVRISNVSIVNEVEPNVDGSYTYQIGGANAAERVGGIAGLVQTSSSQLFMDIIIENCYVKATVGSNGQYNGGIVGRYDDRNLTDSLTISNCYVDGVIKGERRVAGVLGGGTGNGALTVSGCAFVGTLVDGEGNIVTESNSSAFSSIVGDYSSAQASNLAAYFTDRFFDTTILTADSIKLESTWTALGFDMSVWECDTVNGGLTLR